MTKSNANNQRITRDYLSFLKEAKRQSEASIDAAASALAAFAAYNGHRDFKDFHTKQAIGFKRSLAGKVSAATGKPLSKATARSTLAHVKAFFQWLAAQPGYRSRISYTDCEFFNLSENDSRIATAKRHRPVPTLEQIRHTIDTMPTATEIERRNRAVLAFALLTGARDAAIASAKLKHVDLANDCFFQDAREVRTKFAKTFQTYFFPVGDGIQAILADWVGFLRQTLLWGNDDPLFPATRMELGPTAQFQAAGIEPKHWSNATPIRRIFKAAFEAAGLPYFNPHSFRNTLVQLGEQVCHSPEEFKAWSQNLGHDGVLTTFTSYGAIPPSRQSLLIRKLAKGPEPTQFDTDHLATLLLQKMRAADGLIR